MTLYLYSLSVETGVYCSTNYYGSTCDVYCAAEDSCLGHYTCDTSTGAKVCMDGWVGDDCTAQEYPGECPQPGITSECQL